MAQLFEMDRLMPLHVHLAPDATILGVGPTLAKTRSKVVFVGRSLFDLFEFRRPRGVGCAETLRAAAGEPLRLAFRDRPQTGLRGLLSAAPGAGEMLVNLSFGVSIMEAIQEYDLHLTDFAITDPSLEILYLIEAGNAAIEESRALNRRLQLARLAAEERAYTDTLTGLKNRRALSPLLTQYRMQGADYTLMGIDLDFFKSINDSYGHAAGDHVLQEVSRIMQSLTSHDDTLVRTGGDEFLIVLKDVTDLDWAEEMGRALIDRIEAPIPFDGNRCQISASVGVCSTDQVTSGDPAQLLENVDAALYAAKRAGRRQLKRYRPGMDVTSDPFDGHHRLESRPSAPQAHGAAKV